MEYKVKAKLPQTLDKFTRGYLECAEWTIDDEQAEELKSAQNPRWSGMSIEQARTECFAFQYDNEDDLSGYDMARAGHDFWLTRNRHGAGFWDGDYEREVGRRLTDAAQAYGEIRVYYRVRSETLELG